MFVGLHAIEHMLEFSAVMFLVVGVGVATFSTSSFCS
jgi:hypothetical protein